MKSPVYYCDVHRHLVCVPYGKNELHDMAADLNISSCWFHKDHYDIPRTRVREILSQCVIVRPRDIVNIIKGTDQSPKAIEHRPVAIAYNWNLR